MNVSLTLIRLFSVFGLFFLTNNVQSKGNPKYYIGLNGSINYVNLGDNNLRNTMGIPSFSLFKMQELNAFGGLEFSNKLNLAIHLGYINLINSDLNNTLITNNFEKFQFFNFGLESYYKIQVNENITIPISLPVFYSGSFNAEKYTEISGVRYENSEINYSLLRTSLNIGFSYLISQKFDLGIDIPITSYTYQKLSFVPNSALELQTNSRSKLGFLGNHNHLILPFRLKLNYYLN